MNTVTQCPVGRAHGYEGEGQGIAPSRKGSVK